MNFLQKEMDLLEEIQKKKSYLIKEEDFVKKPRKLLAVTVSPRKDNIRGGGILYDLKLKTQINSLFITSYFPLKPYIPTFLSIRNKEPISVVIKHYWAKFDVILIEGAGIQHPRRYGLASEVGLDFNVPTIGITRRSLFGTIDYSQTLNKFKPEFDIHPVFDKNKAIAYFIRKKSNMRGIFLSIGHLYSLDSALELIIPLLKFSFPEPLRLVKKMLKHSK